VRERLIVYVNCKAFKRLGMEKAIMAWKAPEKGSPNQAKQSFVWSRPMFDDDLQLREVWPGDMLAHEIDDAISKLPQSHIEAAKKAFNRTGI
jgi:hypothetical protein